MSYLNKKDKMLQRRAIGHAFAVICLLSLGEACLPLPEPFMQDDTVMHSLDFGESNGH